MGGSYYPQKKPWPGERYQTSRAVITKAKKKPEELYAWHKHAVQDTHASFCGGAADARTAWAKAHQPYILVLWGDDIGQFNISAYNGA